MYLNNNFQGFWNRLILTLTLVTLAYYRTAKHKNSPQYEQMPSMFVHQYLRTFFMLEETFMWY